ncbi:MAG: lipase family protein [Chitinophagaceae bacterium]|nr:MAG: lipase family protein [Chitinophagaceae bacterium]
MKNTTFLFLFALLYSSLAAQLQPGFDASEYRAMLAINFNRYDSVQKAAGLPLLYRKTYTAPVTGLDNRWTLYESTDGRTAVISVRGTVASRKSWLANIYSVMQPAQGTIRLNDSVAANYKLSADNRGAVHSGWLIALMSMSADIEGQLRALHKRGVRAIYITGHSQGGAIAYLLRSYLYYRTLEGALPADIHYKTYCSAAPKPGNLVYAYDYEFINRGGWGFNIVNAADWVPETPISIQQLQDLNPLNPLTDLRATLRRQSFPVRIYANTVYNKLTRKSRKAAGKYHKYLGRKVGGEVRKVLPGLQLPGAVPGLDYARAGTSVVLQPDSAYFSRFPNNSAQGHGVWTHHFLDAYLFLLQKNYLQ